MPAAFRPSREAQAIFDKIMKKEVKSSNKKNTNNHYVEKRLAYEDTARDK